MDRASVVVLIAVVATVVYEAYVTALLARSNALSKQQLVVQVALVWLLPLVGAVICHWFLRLHGSFEQPRELGYPVKEYYDGVEKSDVFNQVP